MQAYQDSPQYKMLLAQALGNDQGPPGYPIQSAASALGKVANTYMLKKLEEKGKQREDDYSKVVASALAPKLDPAYQQSMIDNQMPGNVADQAPHSTPKNGNEIMAALLGSGNADVVKDFAPGAIQQAMTQPKPMSAFEEAQIDRQKTRDAQRQTDADYASLDKGSADIAAAMTPSNVAQLGSTAPGLSWQQRLKLNGQEQEAAYEKTPEYKGKIAAAERKPDAPAPAIDAADPAVQSHVANILAGNYGLGQVPMKSRDAVAVAMHGQPKEAYSPTAASRLTLASERITAPYKKMSQYELTANAKPYLQRIDAALNHPGSVSDQDLLDSLTKLNTGGNAVTEAQVGLITGGKSWSDWVGVTKNQFKNGGVLSENQRAQIHDIANEISTNYKKGWQPIYEKAAKQLRDAQIPEQFWTIPDLNKLDAADDAATQAPGWRPPMAGGAQSQQATAGHDELLKKYGVQ